MRRCAIAIMVGCLMCASVFVGAPRALGFGTTVGQGREHEKITKSALGCYPSGRKPSAGDCFENSTLNQLAGNTGVRPLSSSEKWGAVGNPDDLALWRNLGGPLDARAHCDDLDYLDNQYAATRLFNSYPFDMGDFLSPKAEQLFKLRKCVEYLSGRYQQAITLAKGMLNADGSLNLVQAELPPSGCDFGSTDSTGNAKCDTLLAFGRALHGVEDFYSHTNWTDIATPDAPPKTPYSKSNPPGLSGAPVPSPILDLRAGTFNDADVPQKFTGECFVPQELVGLQDFGKCTRRVTHAGLKKDDGNLTFPDRTTGAILGACTSAKPKCSPRSAATTLGIVIDNGNFNRAVQAAVQDAMRQWTDLRQDLLTRFQSPAVVCALTHDDVNDCATSLSFSGSKYCTADPNDSSLCQTDYANVSVSGKIAGVDVSGTSAFAGPSLTDPGHYFPPCPTTRTTPPASGSVDFGNGDGLSITAYSVGCLAQAAVVLQTFVVINGGSGVFLGASGRLDVNEQFVCTLVPPGPPAPCTLSGTETGWIYGPPPS